MDGLQVGLAQAASMLLYCEWQATHRCTGKWCAVLRWPGTVNVWQGAAAADVGHVVRIAASAKAEVWAAHLCNHTIWQQAGDP